MTATATDTPAPKRSKLPLILGLVLGLAGAGGGFMATRLGLIALPGAADAEGVHEGESGATPAGDDHGGAEEDHAAAADDHAATDDHGAADDHATAGDDHAAEDKGHAGEEGGSVAAARFVALDPMIVNVGAEGGDRYLRFVAQIEAAPGHAVEVEAIKPRFADVLNGYLRAVDIADLENPRALDMLRGQMLRRLQTVAGEGAIRDLLIVEFVLN